MRTQFRLRAFGGSAIARAAATIALMNDEASRRRLSSSATVETQSPTAAVGDKELQIELMLGSEIHIDAELHDSALIGDAENGCSESNTESVLSIGASCKKSPR